tara:strand:- start:275 stop:751 length:477 start_codon:yes stop_codon:yes gene_type:complete
MLKKTYLLKYAVNYLSKYNSSKKNLLRVMKSKITRISKNEYEKNQLFSQISYVIEELEKNNLLNDEIFTQNKILSLSEQGKSKMFISNYLINKGIDKIVIQNKLDEFNYNNNNWEKNSALIFARKNKLFENKDIQKKLGKMSRAGFSYEISKEILKLD